MKSLISLVFIVIIFISCNNITEPEPGRRDYFWETDTIGGYSMRLCKINEKNIWVIGDGSYPDAVWNSDGKSWVRKELPISGTPTGVYGADEREVWVVMLSKGMWKYDGLNWIEEKPLIKEGFEEVVIQQMQGRGKNDIYAVGYAAKLGNFVGAVYHYNGKEWKDTGINNVHTDFIRIEKKNNSSGYFLMAWEWTPEFEYTNLYELENGEVKLLYKDETKLHNLKAIGVIGDELYCIYDDYLCRYKNNKFEKIVETGLLWGGVYITGKNSKDIFILHSKGLLHYDGNNIKVMKEFIGKGNIVEYSKNKIMVFEGRLGTFQKTIIHTGILK